MKSNEEIAAGIRKTIAQLNEELALAEYVGLNVCISLRSCGQKIVARDLPMTIELDSITKITDL